MIRLDVDGRFFFIEFRHQRRTAARGLLPPRTGSLPLLVDAVTTCVIVAVRVGATSSAEAIAFTAIGTTWCWDLDNFSRRTGRLKAFSRAVTECGALRDSKMALLAAYMEHDPDPPPPVKREKLSDGEKMQRWQAGWEVRKRREALSAQGAQS